MTAPPGSPPGILLYEGRRTGQEVADNKAIIGPRPRGSRDPQVGYAASRTPEPGRTSQQPGGYAHRHRCSPVAAPDLQADPPFRGCRGLESAQGSDLFSAPRARIESPQQDVPCVGRRRRCGGRAFRRLRPAFGVDASGGCWENSVSASALRRSPHDRPHRFEARLGLDETDLAPELVVFETVEAMAGSHAGFAARTPVKVDFESVLLTRTRWRCGRSSSGRTSGSAPRSPPRRHIAHSRSPA